MNRIAGLQILEELEEGRDLDARELIAQMGQMNYWAVSGGRCIVGRTSVVFPVAHGYWVSVTLDPSDTYTVRRIFTRAGKVFVKHVWSDVYCDEIGDVAYLASCYLDSVEASDAVTA